MSRWVKHLTEDEAEDFDKLREPYDLVCKYCGSQDVRWRQQGGKWVLFSLTPGVLHQCPVVDEFEEAKS